jgi:transposase InsO family protein
VKEGLYAVERDVSDVVEEGICWFCQSGGANLRALSRRFGICPATGYKWLRRYQSEGDAGLAERSRRPHVSPRRTDAVQEALVIQAAHAHLAWGARKLKAWLENQGRPLPAPSTVHAILRRHGLHEAPERTEHVPNRFEHDVPNELWQMDFKGHFETGSGRCHPLALLDDHSRPYHPQTQGKLERLHETLKAELLQGRYFKQMQAAQQAFDLWRNDCNLERPHEALGSALQSVVTSLTQELCPGTRPAAIRSAHAGAQGRCQRTTQLQEPGPESRQGIHSGEPGHPGRSRGWNLFLGVIQHENRAYQLETTLGNRRKVCLKCACHVSEQVYAMSTV